METNSIESFESDLSFGPLEMGGGMNLTSMKTNFTNPLSQQMEQLLQLHTAMARFKNYTQQAKSCEPDTDEAVDVYSMATTYKQFHGYIALLVCIFGAISNCLIMVVLGRKEMRTPVNTMLLALAIADLLIMIEYIPFALHMYMVDHDLEDKYTYASAAFVFFHVHFTQILHTISIQLTLTMAIWRYAAIKSSTNSSVNCCTFKRCYQVIAAAYICPLFFCILNYLYFQIVPKTKYVTFGPTPFDEIEGNDEEKLHIFQTVCGFLHMHDCTIRKVALYIVESSDLVKQHPILHTIHFWTFSVLIKLIPCVVLTFFMGWMVNTLYKARRHHKMLENKSALPLTPVVGVASTSNINNSPPSQNGECQSPLSPSKNGGGNKIIHPESKKGCTSPSRTIRFANQDDNESPKATLLSSDHQNHNGNGVSVVMIGSNMSLNPDSNAAKNNQGTYSRRVSAGSGGSGGGPGSMSAARRFTKTFIRLPSLRRHSGDGKSGKSSKGCKRTDRTSKMLIAVLFLFLLTEFPQGIMHFLTGWYGPEFLRCKYNPWAEVWDILALINSAINFILYCFMSKQFRTQFQVSFKLHYCFKRPKWATLTACNNNATVSTTV